MGRPKLKLEDKKIKLGITISRDLNKLIESKTCNKSEFIENLNKNYFKYERNKTV